MGKTTRWTESETIQIGKDIFGLATEMGERLARRQITTEFLAECARTLELAEGTAGARPALLGSQKATTLALDDVRTVDARGAHAQQQFTGARLRFSDLLDTQRRRRPLAAGNRHCAHGKRGHSLFPAELFDPQVVPGGKRECPL